MKRREEYGVIKGDACKGETEGSWKRRKSMERAE